MELRGGILLVQTVYIASYCSCYKSLTAELTQRLGTQASQAKLKLLLILSPSP